jgi:hypothetical protein
MIGRHYIAPHTKRVYTAADIVCEGYLYKKGSWMKNWKRRYFVLRKDIRSLCYYASREDLTLLGSIPLDIDTTLANVKPEDAGVKLIFLSISFSYCCFLICFLYLLRWVSKCCRYRN